MSSGAHFSVVLSDRVASLRESATLKINAQVNRMKTNGQTVFNLTAGEPDFPPPSAAKEAVIDAVNRNLSKYTPTAGLPELRTLIADCTNRQQPSVAKVHPWKAADVVVSNGGKQALYNVIQCLVQKGDEVLMAAPFWLSYPEMVRAAEGSPKWIPTSAKNRFQILPEDLRSSITPKTKMLILNSPSNPTGALSTEKEQRELGLVLADFPNVWIVSDEIYDRIEFVPGTWKSFLQVNPELSYRTVTVNGLSKSAAMTGWRIGWSVAPLPLTTAIVALQGHSTSGISSLSQAAAIAALKLPEETFEPQRRQYLHRRDLSLAILNQSAKLKVFAAEGAFYLFVDVKESLRENENADGFAERLLQDTQVAVVSGVDFGAQTSIRISFATDETTLTEACRRLVDYCDRLS